MTEKPIRLCPECRVPVIGEQESQEPDWFKFDCPHCDEEWGENTRYCTSDDQVDTNI